MEHSNGQPEPAQEVEAQVDYAWVPIRHNPWVRLFLVMAAIALALAVFFASVGVLVEAWKWVF